MCTFYFNDGDKITIGHKKIKVHMILNVKMITLSRKARLVAERYLTDSPKELVILECGLEGKCLLSVP